MKNARTGNSIDGAFDEAYFIVFELCEEMREAFDNTPEQFKTNSGRHREIAADDLDSLFRPAIPKSISGHSHRVEWREMQAGKNGKLNRPNRRDNVVHCLKACLAYAHAISDESKEMEKFRSDLEIDISILSQIQFLGMAGR